MAGSSVRLLFLAGSNQVPGLNLWQWPQYLTLFFLGAVAAERGRLDNLSRPQSWAVNNPIDARTQGLCPLEVPGQFQHLVRHAGSERDQHVGVPDERADIAGEADQVDLQMWNAVASPSR